MPVPLSNDRVRFMRQLAQQLIPQRSDAPASVSHLVKEMCGIQAQDAPAAALAIRARSVDLLAADVEHALMQERSIVRTWGPRGTLHLLATEDLGWLLTLLGPAFVAGDRRRRAELGLDEDTCARGIRIIHDVLASRGPLTRAEIVEQLAARGMLIEGQARPHLLARAALEGVICFGPDRGAEPTYVLLSDWIDYSHMKPSLSETAAYTELTRRYLNAYGPAALVDQAAWSGLPLSKIRTAWQHIMDQLLEVEIASSPAWMLKENAARLDEPPSDSPIVRLLPRFDIYLLGYQNRDLSVPPQYAKRINAGGGMLHPAVLVDGYTVGTWRSKREKNHLNIAIEPFDSLTPEPLPGIEAEVKDIARFLETEVGSYII